MGSESVGPVTIALVSNAAWGVKLLRSDLIEFLTRCGHSVSVVCELDSTVPSLREMGVSVVGCRMSRSGTNPVRELLVVLRLKRRLARLGPDLVMNFTPKGVIYGSIAAWLAGNGNVFSVVTGLGYVFAGRGVRGLVMRRVVVGLYRFALRRNRMVFFQNGDDRDTFTQKGLVRRSRTRRVRGSGVDVGRFAPVSRGDGNADTVFLMISRLLKEKGVMEYVEAVAVLKREGHEFRAGLLGPFDEENPAAVRASALGPYLESGVVEYLGVAKDVRPALGSCDVFVLPSYYPEGTPRTVLEALAMGKPVITTDAPGCRETVVDGDNGYLIPTRNVTALAGAMRKLVREPDLIPEMGARSRRLAETYYDVERVNGYLWGEITKHALRLGGRHQR